MRDRTKYYLEMAKLVSQRSTCCRAKVGAILTNHNRVVGTGYNGGPAGTPHCIDSDCIKDEEGRCIVTIHAEANAIISREGQSSPSDMLIMYCTHAPCRHCYKLMVQYGVRMIYAIEGYSDKYRDKLVELWGVPIKIINRTYKCRNYLCKNSVEMSMDLCEECKEAIYA